MAKNVTHTHYNVQPQDDLRGNMIGLNIQRVVRTERVSDNGRTLEYGQTINDGDPLYVEADDVVGLVTELVSWPMYYATGQSQRDHRAGIAQGFSRQREIEEHAKKWNCSPTEAVERLVNSALSEGH